MFPVKARTITIKRISPNPPLGQYPQPELYGQAGSAPTNRRIRMINRMVPMASPFFHYVRRSEALWTFLTPPSQSGAPAYGQARKDGML
jgi:hypothetical protein